LIIDLLNKGNVDEALRYIDAIPEVMFAYQKAKLLLAAAGRLKAKELRQLIGNALRMFKKFPQIELDIKSAGVIYEEIIQLQNHPLQTRAMYELAKVSFWI